MLNCGICNKSPDQLAHQNGIQNMQCPMYCSSCINRKMSLKVEYLNILIESSNFRNEISDILRLSHPRDYIDNINEIRTNKSVFTLATQLKIVETNNLRRKIETINNLKKQLESSNNELRHKKLFLQELLKKKQTRYKKNEEILIKTFNSKQMHLSENIRRNKSSVIGTQSLIRNERALLYQHLCNLLLIRKIKMNHVNKLSIGCQSIVPVNKYISYSSRSLISSLELICQFLYFSSYYLNINLPFKINPPSKPFYKFIIHGLNENLDSFLQISMNDKFMDQNEKLTISKVPPKNLLLMLNGYSYDEIFNSSNVIDIPNSLHNLNLVELFEFSILISKIVINLFTMADCMDIFRNDDDNYITYNTLYNVDELLYLIVSGGNNLNDGFSMKNPSLKSKLKFQLEQYKEKETGFFYNLFVLGKKSNCDVSNKGNLYTNGGIMEVGEEPENLDNESYFGREYFKIHMELDNKINAIVNDNSVVKNISLTILSFKLFRIFYDQSVQVNSSIKENILTNKSYEKQKTNGLKKDIYSEYSDKSSSTNSLVSSDWQML